MILYIANEFTFRFGNSASSNVIIWSFVLVAILIVGFVAVTKAKKRLRDDHDMDPGVASGFTLSDLREMHRSGQISDEEFERAKAKIVEVARKAADRDKQSRKREPGQDGPGM
jgi:Short C-terminal domain